MVWRVFESCCHLRLEHLVSYFCTVLRHVTTVQCKDICRYGQNTHFWLLRPTEFHNSIIFCKTLRKYLSRHVKGKKKISYTIAFYIRIYFDYFLCTLSFFKEFSLVINVCIVHDQTHCPKTKMNEEKMSQLQFHFP